MRAVITVIGHDTVGIIARTSAVLARHSINILDITQSVMGDIFAMVMFADITESTVPFRDLQNELEALGAEIGVQISAVHEDIFNAMHTV